MPSNDPTELFHDEVGNPAGTALVMIHPLGADHTFWHEFGRRLGSKLRMISLDLRGAGRSPDLDAPLSLNRVAEDVEALRRALSLERIVVVGCAVGAMGAARYAATYPSSTLALIMSNPGFRIVPETARALQERARAVRDEGMKALLPQAIDNAFVGYEGTEMRRRYMDGFLSNRPENYALAALGAASADISGDLDRLRCPVLLVPGGNDPLFPRGLHADAIAEALPAAQLVEFPEGAHFIPYQQPEAFGNLVSEFLSRSLPSAETGAI